MKHPLLNVPRIRSILPLAATSLVLASWAPTASARLFLDPTGGTVIKSNTVNASQDIVGYPLPYINYFGTGGHLYSSVSVNGNLYYGADPSIEPEPGADNIIGFLGASGYNQISPFWQDFSIGTNGSISVIDPYHDSGFPDFVAVTWQNMELTNPTTAGLTGSFQAIIFQRATTLNSINFQAGDIIFSYGDLQWYSELNEHVIGLQNEIWEIAYAPRSMHEGWYSPVMAPTFPYADNEYLLFRPDGTGGYTPSIQAIPEPSTVVALLSGSLLIGWQAFRRRRG